MASCSPQYTVTNLQPSGPCGEICDGVSTGPVTVDGKIDQHGNCVFTYEVERLPDGKVFSGKESITCPNTKAIEIHCTDDKTCVLMRIELWCEESQS